MKFIKKILYLFAKIYGSLFRTKPISSQSIYDKEILSPISHNTKESMNKFYGVDNFVEKYIDKTRDLFYQKVSEIVVKQIHNKNLEICDIGCGQGDLLNYIYLKKINNKFIGLDFSNTAISIANSRFPFIEFLEFDITTDYNTYAQQFDILICTEVLEHLIDPRKALSNIKAMAKENAIIILTVPEGRNDNFIGHINFWSPESWNQFVKEEKGDFKFAETFILPIEQYCFNAAILRRTI